jgi:hypothetical protein
VSRVEDVERAVQQAMKSIAWAQHQIKVYLLHVDQYLRSLHHFLKRCEQAGLGEGGVAQKTDNINLRFFFTVINLFGFSHPAQRLVMPWNAKPVVRVMETPEEGLSGRGRPHVTVGLTMEEMGEMKRQLVVRRGRQVRGIRQFFAYHARGHRQALGANTRVELYVEVWKVYHRSWRTKLWVGEEAFVQQRLESSMIAAQILGEQRDLVENAGGKEEEDRYEEQARNHSAVQVEELEHRRRPRDGIEERPQPPLVGEHHMEGGWDGVPNEWLQASVWTEGNDDVKALGISMMCRRTFNVFRTWRQPQRRASRNEMDACKRVLRSAIPGLQEGTSEGKQKKELALWTRMKNIRRNMIVGKCSRPTYRLLLEARDCMGHLGELPESCHEPEEYLLKSLREGDRLRREGELE